MAAQILGDGVTEMRLFTMGMPNSRSSCSAVGTRRLAAAVMRSYTLRAMTSISASVQPRRFNPSVIVRMSRCCFAHHGKRLGDFSRRDLHDAPSFSQMMVRDAYRTSIANRAHANGAFPRFRRFFSWKRIAV